MKGGKKAVSPLIATVFLIAFVITISAIIQNFNTGFFSSQQAATTEKSTAALNCAYNKLKINSASYNGTSSSLKIRVTNDNQNSEDAVLTNITFSVIMQDTSSSVYTSSCFCGNEALGAGETKFYTNSSVTGGCNITSVFVTSSCSNAKDSVSSSGIDFTGC